MTDADVSRELIEQFRAGATVAELVRQARRRVGGDRPKHDWTKAVRAAFGLSVGGWYVVAGTESFGNGAVPDSKLTWVFLPSILANRQQWDAQTDGPPRWYDGLTKTPFEGHRAAALAHHGLSPEGWAALSDKDREKVIWLEKMRLSLGEDVQILAALAERLQQRVNELELRDHQPATAGTV